jgi:uncharacterized membrane protein
MHNIFTFPPIFVDCSYNYANIHTQRKAEYVKTLAIRNSHTLQFMFTLNVYLLRDVNVSHLKAGKLLHIS